MGNFDCISLGYCILNFLNLFGDPYEYINGINVGDYYDGLIYNGCGWMKCDGSIISESDYPLLYEKLKIGYGCVLPDYRTFVLPPDPYASMCDNV